MVYARCDGRSRREKNSLFHFQYVSEKVVYIFICPRSIWGIFENGLSYSLIRTKQVRLDRNSRIVSDL